MGFTGDFLEVAPTFTLTKFSPTIEVILRFTKELDIDLEATIVQLVHELRRTNSTSLFGQSKI